MFSSLRLLSRPDNKRGRFIAFIITFGIIFVLTIISAIFTVFAYTRYNVTATNYLEATSEDIEEGRTFEGAITYSLGSYAEHNEAGATTGVFYVVSLGDKYIGFEADTLENSSTNESIFAALSESTYEALESETHINGGQIPFVGYLVKMDSKHQELFENYFTSLNYTDKEIQDQTAPYYIKVHEKTEYKSYLIVFIVLFVVTLLVCVAFVVIEKLCDARLAADQEYNSNN